MRCRSAIIATNSLFVGLPLSGLTVCPKYLRSMSGSARSQVTSIAWRMARSTRLLVVRNFFAVVGYSSLVIVLLIMLGLLMVKIITSRT